MPTPPKHRDAIVRAAADLFRRQGYAATGLNEIVAASGAPKGSLYHYFPQGKEQIGEEVVRAAGRLVAGTLAELARSERTPGALLRRYGRMVVGWMEASGFEDGGPITTVLLELAPGVDGVTAAGREAFASWAAVLGGELTARGVTPARARRLSTLAIAALEGALVLARVQQDGRPIRDATEAVAELLDAATAAG
jgi:TetR/AcrR family transcriptional regulator, lmrAB and yxaGH operons repressor